MQNGIVVFLGFDASSRGGLYGMAASGGPVVRLVDTSTTVPGGTTTFTSFGHAAFDFDGTTVIFTGLAGAASGIYTFRLDGAVAARVADRSTPVNSNTCDAFPVMNFSKPSISQGNIAFLGQTTFDYNAGFSALYTNALTKSAAAKCAGPTAAAANSTQALPGNTGGHTQAQFDYAQADGTTVVFRAVEGATGFGGIFSTTAGASPGGGVISRVVDVDTQLPGFGGVAYFGNYQFAVDGGNVVFFAHEPVNEKSALFLAAGGAIKRIAGTGDAVDNIEMLSVDAPGAGSVQGQAVSFTGTRFGGSRVLYLAEPAVAAPASFSAQSVANSASNRAGAVSPGEIVAVFGSGMGAAGSATAAFDANGRVATQLGGVRVLFDGIPAPILYLSAGQANVIVPYAMEGRASAQLTVEYNGASTAPLSVPVADCAPGIYSMDGSGQGPGAIVNEDATLNSPANPAAQGSIVALYGTGEGQTAPGGIDGQLATQTLPAPRRAVSVTVGGQPVTDVLYSGAAPGEVAGMLQVNFRVPTGLPAGNLPVVLQVGNAVSQGGLTIAVL